MKKTTRIIAVLICLTVAAAFMPVCASAAPQVERTNQVVRTVSVPAPVLKDDRATAIWAAKKKLQKKIKNLEAHALWCGVAYADLDGDYCPEAIAVYRTKKGNCTKIKIFRVTHGKITIAFIKNLGRVIAFEKIVYSKKTKALKITIAGSGYQANQYYQLKKGKYLPKYSDYAKYSIGLDRVYQNAKGMVMPGDTYRHRVNSLLAGKKITIQAANLQANRVGRIIVGDPD